MAAHIYWRISFTEPPDGVRATNISRLELHPIPAGINLCLPGNGYISASSERPPEKNDTFVAYNALNNNSRADWMSVVESVSWLKYEFVTPQEVQEILFSASNDKNYILNAPQDFELQWSNDDINWTTSFSIAGEINWSKGETRVFSTDAKIDTIGRGYTNYLAGPVTPFTDHLLAIEKEGALSLSVHRDKVTPLTQADHLSSAQVIDIISTQYVSLGVATEKNEAIKATVKVTVVLIVPTTQTSSALPFTFKKVRCPIGDKSYAYPFTMKFTKRTDDCSCGYAIIPYRHQYIPIGPADWDDTAYSVAHTLSKGISLATSNSKALFVSRGTINIEIGQASTYNLVRALNADKRQTMQNVVDPASASVVGHSFNHPITASPERDTAASITSRRDSAISSSPEKDTAYSLSVARGWAVSQSISLSSGYPLKIDRNTSVLPAVETEIAQNVVPTRGFDFLRSTALSSALPMTHARGDTIQPAIELSSGILVVVPQYKLLGQAAEHDEAIDYFSCPIYEADSAYSIERGFPDLVHTSPEKDESLSVRPNKQVVVNRAYTADSTLEIRFARVTVLGQVAEYDGMIRHNYLPFTPVRTVPFLQATVKSTAYTANEDKSQTLGRAATSVNAQRVFPPFSGTLGIAGEDDTNSELSSAKSQEIIQGLEKDEAFLFSSEHALELGVALEDDIARLYSHFNVVRLGLINAQSGGLPIDPLRTTEIGQAASKDEGLEWNRDRDIPIGVASTGSSATTHYIHVADQFNQAVESELALYVTAVKSKALQLAQESDTIRAIDKTLKAKGINLGTEQDTANTLATAFAHDFSQAAESEDAINLTRIKTLVLGVAQDGMFAYTLDRWLKEQGIGRVVEQDVAHIPVANLTKEIKRALEYNEAQRIDATRVKFLQTVATDEVAHALGQTMKRKLIGLAASSTDAPYLNGEQPWRNKWQASSSIQEDIEFSLSMQQDFEGVVSLQQDIEFVVAIQDDKQFIEEI